LNVVGTMRIKMEADPDYHQNITSDDFLIMKDIGLGASTQYPTKSNCGFTVLEKSKLQTPDLVIYFRTLNNKLDKTKHRELIQEYLKILAFRAVFETSDANNHNFLIKLDTKQLYSIDENVIFKGFDNKKMFSHYPAREIGETLHSFVIESDYMLTVCENWLTMIEKDPNKLYQLLAKFEFEEMEHLEIVKANLKALIQKAKNKELKFCRE